MNQYGEAWDKGKFQGKAWVEADSPEQAIEIALRLQKDYVDKGYRDRCKAAFGIKDA